MNAAMAFLAWLAEHGPVLALGASVVLLGGAAAMALHRDPAQRRRLGIATAVGVLLYLVVGVAPLPRIVVPGMADAQPAVVDLAPAPAPPLDSEARASRLLAALQGLGIGEPVAVVATVPGPAVEPAGRPVAAAAPSLSDRLAAVPWSLGVAGLYTGGALFLLLRTLVGHRRLRALLAGCRPVPAAVLGGLDLPRGTRVLRTDRAVRPFCAGVWRPAIVLPESLLAPERAAEAAAVLRHEAAHVRAGDARVWTLLAWLAVPLFWHPLLWWLCREVRFCSELLADDAAARAGGRQRYARALIELAERADAQVAAAGTVAVFHRPSEFYRRIQMLLQRQGPLSTSTSRLRRTAQSFALLCLVGGAASLFGVRAAAQDPAPRALRHENAELRATIDLLRAELDGLRAQIQALRDGQGAPASAGNGLPAGALRTPLGDQAPHADVPVLSRLPLLNNLFQIPAAQDPVAAPDPAPRRYTVQKGDSLARIAKEHLGNAQRTQDFFALNPGLDPARLRPGQEILLPPAASPTGEQPPPGADLARDPAPPASLDTLLAPDPQARPAASLDVLLGASVGTPPPSTPGSVTALADLTSRYLDLQAELEVQRAAAEETGRLAAAGLAPQREAKRAEVTVRALERKLAICEQLIDGEIHATEAELQWLEQRRAGCSPTEALQIDVQQRRARTRLQALQAVK